MTAQCESP